MPRPVGVLLSFNARGRIGGHRRGWKPPPVYAPFAMPLVGALVPGVLSTGIKDPEVPYHGDPFAATVIGLRASVAAQGQAITGFIRKNGGHFGPFSIPPGTKAYTLPITGNVSDGDWFDLDLIQVGTPPNEGSDLVWLVSGVHTH